MNDTPLCLVGALTLLVFAIFIGVNQIFKGYEIQEEDLSDEERGAVGFQSMGCGIAILLNIVLPILLSLFVRLSEPYAEMIYYSAATIGIVLAILVGIKTIRHRVFSMKERHGPTHYYRGGLAIFAGVFFVALAVIRVYTILAVLFWRP